MDNPVVIITGASRGLGAAGARACASLGANVVLSARSESDLVETAEGIRAAGGEATVIPADVRIEQDCRRLVGSTVEQFDRIDALVNNAGTLEPIQRIEHADQHAWRVNWQVNVLGPVMLSRAVLPALRRSSGRIVNVSSGAAVRPISGWGAYSAAKAAVTHLTRILAQEEPAVTAVALRPGAVDTEMQSLIRDSGARAMASETFLDYVRKHEENLLLPPEKPGRAMAALALACEPGWSGEFIQWDDDRVAGLVDRLFGAG